MNQSPRQPHAIAAGLTAVVAVLAAVATVAVLTGPGPEPVEFDIDIPHIDIAIEVTNQ